MSVLLARKEAGGCKLFGGTSLAKSVNSQGIKRQLRRKWGIRGMFPCEWLKRL